MTKKLIIILILFLSFLGFSQELDLNDFVHELSARQSRVEEFVSIKKIANKLGIKNVYMFGGTAAAWGHYIRWDMRRELGIEKLQFERFDYDYTNIFRSSQDFDIVIDGTAKQAQALESLIQEKFNYFSGARPTWEVRLLNESRADKDPILGSDFQNQHTDSHSTGLIEMMDCEGFDCIKDVRDMENEKSQFLLDLYEANLHYYYSDLHHSTKRFRLGMNPEILSVIRYFTKVVQYDLSTRRSDLNRLQNIIDKINSSEIAGWDLYVKNWLRKNAKKLIINAINMESAQRIIEETGLREKLSSIGDVNLNDSMAWWLNKKALEGFVVGEGDGKKASELFKPNQENQIIVSHETNSFAAFESILKSHTGSANVLISRKDVLGENAIHGDGHYTKLGNKGAAGTGLTIRYVLNPDARQGSDFNYVEKAGFVVIKNKNAITTIQEKLSFSLTEYFQAIANGLSFDASDKGVVEKLRRKLLRKANKISAKQIKYIEDKIVIPNRENRNLISEWNDLIVNKNNRIKYKENVDLQKAGFSEEFTKVFNKRSKVARRWLAATGLIAGANVVFAFSSILLNTEMLHTYNNLFMINILPMFASAIFLMTIPQIMSESPLRIRLRTSQEMIKSKLKRYFGKIKRTQKDFDFTNQAQFSSVYQLSDLNSLELRVISGDGEVEVVIAPSSSRAYRLSQYSADISKFFEILGNRKLCDSIYRK